MVKIVISVAAMSLPIEQIKTEFLRLLPSHHLVVEAETGSGKSTFLPLWAQQQGRVLVVQPRRIACTSLANYLAALTHTKLGDTVGYAVKFAAEYTDHTKIVFVTPGIALRWFAENKLSSFDIVIVDEMHLRRWDTDLLLAMLREHQHHRLVVTSATINAERFCRYLNGVSLRAEGRRYNVTVNNLASESLSSPTAKDLDRRVRDAIETYGDATTGDILVFLPGRKEIQQCQASLKTLDADVIPLHASVSDHDRQRALEDRTTLNQAEPNTKQRIILATNIAETSLTIANVTLIIDSGLERRTHQRNGRTVLGLHSISKASAEQRKGRAGRVADGLCVRLYGSAAPLDSITPPDMQREELTEPMLAAASCGYRLDTLPLLETLPEKTLAQAHTLLRNMQAIDTNGLITPHGQALYPLPIDPLFAHLITAMPSKAAQEAMVDLASALTVPQRLYTLPSATERREQLDQWEPLHCDAQTLIKLVRGETDDVSESGLQLNPDSIAEARQNAVLIRDALGLPQLEVASRVPRDLWLKAVFDTAPELVFVRREKRMEALGNGKMEVIAAKESRIATKDTAFIVFDQFHLPGKGKKQTLNLATCLAPVPLKMLVDAGFGALEIAQSQIIDGSAAVVQHRVFAGRIIDTVTQAPQGSGVTDAALQLILSGEIFPTLVSRIGHQIAQWQLYLGLNHDGTPAPTLDTWLREQLDALGLESVDDLALFSEDDFVFEGIPEWEQEAFDATYPRYLQLADLNLTVDYAPKGKQVTVIYHSGGRKADPKRWELPTWSGWRIQYRKASRVVDIK
uniref:DEAD/DEAH box helicase n=1 Tax=Thaumasiovibrio occultus TaxID=1891184 RepID=UPI0018644A3D|nr:DEAD/DEAH box helicase [Thaumasiovibrio occultus]